MNEAFTIHVEPFGNEYLWKAKAVSDGRTLKWGKGTSFDDAHQRAGTCFIT